MVSAIVISVEAVTPVASHQLIVTTLECKLSGLMKWLNPMTRNVNKIELRIHYVPRADSQDC